MASSLERHGDPAPRARRVSSFYIELSHEVVVWYARLSPRDRASADRAFDRLAAEGPALREPHSRALRGGLHELRFTCEGASRRITYAFGRGREVRALTTFRKQRDVERDEVARARRAMIRGHARAKGRARGDEQGRPR